MLSVPDMSISLCGFTKAQPHRSLPNTGQEGDPILWARTNSHLWLSGEKLPTFPLWQLINPENVPKYYLVGFVVWKTAGEISPLWDHDFPSSIRALSSLVKSGENGVLVKMRVQGDWSSWAGLASDNPLVPLLARAILLYLALFQRWLFQNSLLLNTIRHAFPSIPKYFWGHHL